MSGSVLPGCSHPLQPLGGGHWSVSTAPVPLCKLLWEGWPWKGEDRGVLNADGLRGPLLAGSHRF